jgi:hypothetical protein
MSKLTVFLDFDGVLNNEEDRSLQRGAFSPYNTHILSEFLDHIKDYEVVLSTAWRYYINHGHMTLKGMEILLQTHSIGYAKQDFVVGQTLSKLSGSRQYEIKEYIEDKNVTNFLVLDDLDMKSSFGDRQIVCNSRLGFTREQADRYLKTWKTSTH